jgi:hypothetical protein
MENTPKITIEDLAVKLNGNMWTKGDLKRIYLDRGYNTKKMSTKTYVEETSKGNFNVKCFVECPSQDYNWCKSQANQVIERLESEIEEILNPSIETEEEIISEQPAVCSPEYDTWRQLNIINALPELSLEEIIEKEIELNTRLHANRAHNYLKESIALNNLRRRIFVGKKIEEVVGIVRNCPLFVAEFTVACTDGIVKKIEDTAYHGISMSSKFDIFMIETNSDKKNFWKRSENGFYTYEIK